jgi:hypothetical protein
VPVRASPFLVVINDILTLQRRRPSNRSWPIITELPQRIWSGYSAILLTNLEECNDLPLTYESDSIPVPVPQCSHFQYVKGNCKAATNVLELPFTLRSLCGVNGHSARLTPRSTDGVKRSTGLLPLRMVNAVLLNCNFIRREPGSTPGKHLAGLRYQGDWLVIPPLLVSLLQMA